VLVLVGVVVADPSPLLETVAVSVASAKISMPR